MMQLLEQSPFDPAKEQRIVIIADWLPPDFGAVGQYMLMRAQALAEQGHDVTLVGLSSARGSTIRQLRGKGQLTEIRLNARPVPRGSLVGRMLWTIATNLRLILAAFGPLRAADGILFTGSPPFLIHLLAPLKPLWRGKLVYRITDFHPECLIAARDRPSRALGFLLGLTNFWRRKVDGFEVLGEDQRRRLTQTGIPADRIALVRDGSPVSFAGDTQVEPLPAELAGKCVLLYSGNYGVAHEVETVARGYELHHKSGSGRVHLWLSATGAGAEDLAARFAAAGLPFHRSSPVPLERLSGLLRAPVAHLVTLRDAFVGYVMPSKIYACIESGKPVLFVGSAASDVDLLAAPAPAGYWRVPCGDADGFAAALEEMADRCRAGTS
ncbi:glycosyltransferase [Reyranella sp. MMS21-HV4-11]|uniref:Glycosyltransferase n=1 Tax=Reyranella humidisoli TaxID=2849149 RepID=A0ABS6ILG8_9HYPH|nr:glycosyltransferase [Reyranella sp. MMS21-HV4-11]